MSPFPDRGRTNDQRLAEDLAAQAGRMLTDLRVSTRIDRDELGEIADAEAQSLVFDRLRITRPDDVIFSDAAPDDTRRIGADRVWFIDPLDGVRSYGMEGRPDWAVHIALWERDQGTSRGSITACAIAMPAYGRVLTGRGATTYMPQSIIRGPRPGPLVPPREDNGRLRLAVSESAPPDWAEELAAELDADLAHLGSGGGKTATVVEGECDAFLQASPHHQWDSAAAVGVAHLRGLVAARLDGSELVYNQPDPEFPDLLVATEAAAERIIPAVSRYLD